MNTRDHSVSLTGNEPFREEDIRPDHLMDGALEATKADIERLLSRSHEFVDVACPGCDSKASRYLFSKHGFEYQSCTRCQTFYISPRPSPEVLDWFYEKSATYSYWNERVFPASEKARHNVIVVPRVNRVLEIFDTLGVSPGSLLEIGAGFGTFCLEVAARNRFDRVVAVEPTHHLAETCRKRGIETVELSFESYAESETVDRFSVIASFEVIEHVFSPRHFLESVHRLLTPGGVLVLTCPNGQGFDIQTLGKLSDSVDHEHLNYFSPASLSQLCERLNFEVLETRTPGMLDAELVRKKVMAGEFDLSAQPFLKRVLLDNWETEGHSFQRDLADHGKSSSMWVVARKTS